MKKERPNLTLAQRIQFLQLFIKMSGQSTFERVLGLDAADVAHYKKMLDVESPEEARVLLRKLKRENQEAQEARIMEQTKRVREAQDVANKRLEELEAKRSANKPPKQYDANAIKQEDANRQRKWEQSQEKVSKPKKEWTLVLEGSESQREETVNRFRRDIVNRGIAFCRKKYNATENQLRFEAKRLKLNIDWDIVRR